MADDTSYHIVFRPPLDILPIWEDMLSWVTELKYLKAFCLSGEKGKSKGMEEFNHYDIVVTIGQDRRTDSLKRSICDTFGIPGNKRRNIRCYRIDKGDRLLYQIGYCLKEGIRHECTYGDFAIEDACALYEKTGPISKPENFKEDMWSVDDFAIHFREWLTMTLEKENEIRFMDASTYFLRFMRMNRDRLKFSTYSKINKDRMCEYVADVGD